MALSNIKDLIDCELEGRTRRYNFRKTCSQTTTANFWFDYSMSPGNPSPKYWFDASPLVAKAVSQSEGGGIYHGPSVSPYTKYIRKLTVMCSYSNVLPMPLILCDYLLYYPSIDDSITDPQELDNTVTLPRYTSGEGVQVIAVSLASRTGGQSFSFTYTNSDGVAGRVSGTRVQNSASAIGTLQGGGTSSAGTSLPYLELQSGDKGVRSIESVTMAGADTGLFALILVRPLATIHLFATNAPYEKDFFIMGASVPEIQDNAFLGFLTTPRENLGNNSVLMGDLQIIWN